MAELLTLRIVPPPAIRRDEALHVAVELCADLHSRLPEMRAAAPKQHRVQVLVDLLDEQLLVIHDLVKQGAAGACRDGALRLRLENALNDFVAVRHAVPLLRQMAYKNAPLLILVDFTDKQLDELHNLVGAGWAANELIGHLGARKEGVA